jgi:hypothetical protein
MIMGGYEFGIAKTIPFFVLISEGCGGFCFFCSFFLILFFLKKRNGFCLVCLFGLDFKGRHRHLLFE